MGKLRQTALILGEGPTEFFYFKSLCDVFKRLTIKPDYPKHTNIKDLEAKIDEGVAMGYSHIFCIIDMDTKDKEPECSQYQKLKAKYAKPINKPKKGIYCEVEFFETHRCTELFFLYYFRYTSRPYVAQRHQPMRRVSKDDRVLHQNQRIARLLRAPWWQSRKGCGQC